MPLGTSNIYSARLNSLVLALLLLTLSSCGSQTGTVSGTVSYKGKPLPGGNVILTSDGEGAGLKTSDIQPDGTYTIARVPVGPVTVTVRGKRYPKTFLLPGQGKPGGQQVKHKDVFVPPKYGHPKTSGLKYDVQPGPQKYDIDLK